jgi:hypothetical protein
MFNEMNANFKITVESLQEIITFFIGKIDEKNHFAPHQLDQNVILNKSI